MKSTLRRLGRGAALGATASLLLACAGVGKDDLDADQGDCPDYLLCAEALGEPMATLEAVYGAEGVCWDSAEPNDAVLCRAQCTDALTVYHETYPSEPACAGDPDYVPQGRWGVDGACYEDVVATGNGEGQTADDFTLLDQDGNEVRLHDFCGRAVALMSTAIWDGGAPNAAARVQGWQDEFGPEGFQGIVLLAENSEGVAPTQAELQDFAANLGLDLPVLADPDWAVNNRFEQDSAIPTFVLLGPNAKVIAVDDFDMDADDVRGALP